MTGPSLINVRGLTKPATVLVEKISNAVGILWEPTQIRRIAQAKSDAALILANNEIEIDDVKRRAARRFVEEETRSQQNMESIGIKAIPNLNPNAPTKDVEDDWIANFFDKCRIVSDNDMQDLWSRVLAGEANSPGSFSRKTVNLMADLDKASAQLFVSLCRFGWRIDDLFSVGQLNSIGLVQIGSLGFETTEQPKEVVVTYHDRSVPLIFPKETGNSLRVGEVLFTPSGIQLAQIVESTPIDGFFEFLYDRWASESLVPPRANQD